MNNKNFAISFLILIIFGTVAFLFFRGLEEKERIMQSQLILNTQENKNKDSLRNLNENGNNNIATNQIIEQLPTPETQVPAKKAQDLIELTVPFVVQAPSGNWDNPIFQDACEEASVIMAMGWVRGVAKISPAEAEKQIEEIANFENATFGYNANTSVWEVEKIMRDYFKHANVTVREDISAADIHAELKRGGVVLVPAFGQALNNPNYTAPGPVAHMLAVTGYDPGTEEFITNDPGTRKGASYRYHENILFDAIWAYPSGSEKLQAPSGPRKKAMVIVQKP